MSAKASTGTVRRSLATPPEVAEFLQVPVRTLVAWRYHRKGPRWAKVGRGIRYRWTDVEKWIDEQTKAAA